MQVLNATSTTYNVVGPHANVFQKQEEYSDVMSSFASCIKTCLQKLKLCLCTWCYVRAVVTDLQ